MDAWQIVLTAVAGGAALLATAVFAGLKDLIAVWFSRLRRQVHKRTYIQEVSRLAEFLEVFEKIKKIVGVQKCLMFHGHNCGGLPTVGKPYTVKAVHGWTTKTDKEDPLETYSFELQVDGHYIRMLEDVIKSGYSEQIFEKMPQDAKLRAFYELEGIQYARIYYLGLVDRELIFLTAATYDSTSFNNKTIVALNFIVEHLRSIMGEG